MLGNLTDIPMTVVSTSTPRAPGFERECDLHACLEDAHCVGCSWDPKATERLYEHRLQWSEFSLIVRGDTPSSARLYDALAYGVSPPPAYQEPMYNTKLFIYILHVILCIQTPSVHSCALRCTRM